ncbi:MAG: hypothetical protein JOY84_18295 [Curvibacter sp.]|nr:hypothetical protein [Curvibacter sp.]
MEELVGLWWHGWLTRLATKPSSTAAVALADMAGELGLLFRALGGAHGLRVDATSERSHGARRAWIERLAGVREKCALASVDAQALRLPAVLDAYPDAALNRALYRWLTALCAVAPASGTWLQRNQQGSRFLLGHCAGLAQVYRDLVAAELQRRPAPRDLPSDEARLESALRAALVEPGSQSILPASGRPHEPMLLWLSPDGAGPLGMAPALAEPLPEHRPASSMQEDRKRRQTQEAELPERDGGLLIFRPESIFSWAEYAKVQHEVQENEDEDLAKAADDLDSLSVSDVQRAVAKSLRMNLDRAPRSESLAEPSNPAFQLPEWDYRKSSLKPGHCTVRLQPLPDATATATALPERLRQDQRRLHRQLAALRPERQVRRRQVQGDDLDLDACVRWHTESATGQQDCYQAVRRQQRDLSCLLLADLSLSTEATIAKELRVIDVIRDSLLLFAESLTVTRDRFAMYGFHSRLRHDVRLSELKRFDQNYDARVRARIAEVKPAFYTRMGAAIRYASHLLGAEASRVRLLLILTDGKPNDSDEYEGRYGVEDTRHALQEARRMGLHPFCVTVDQSGQDYLPHLFGKHGYTIVQRPAELPRRLALLYAQLTSTLF